MRELWQSYAEECRREGCSGVTGRVKIGAGCWIGPGACIRGDYGRILIGDNTSIEDNCVIHARPEEQTTIGDWVTVGHGAIVHNATVRDWAIIGMGSVVSDWSEIGRWAVVGEGAVVRQGQQIAAEAIAVGVPARVLGRSVNDQYREDWTQFKKIYVDLASRYAKGLTFIDLQPMGEEPARPSLWWALSLQRRNARRQRWLINLPR